MSKCFDYKNLGGGVSFFGEFILYICLCINKKRCARLKPLQFFVMVTSDVIMTLGHFILILKRNFKMLSSSLRSLFVEKASHFYIFLFDNL